MFDWLFVWLIDWLIDWLIVGHANKAGKMHIFVLFWHLWIADYKKTREKAHSLTWLKCTSYLLLQQTKKECIHSIRLNLQNGQVHFFRSHPSKQTIYYSFTLFFSPLWKMCLQGSTQIESASLSSSTSYSHVQMQHAPCVSLLASISISQNGLISNFYRPTNKSKPLASPILSFRSTDRPTRRPAALPIAATPHSWDLQG